jgi:hypothetical protein
VAPFDISDEVEVARYARKRFRAGHSLYMIAAALALFRVPVSEGGEYRPCDVKHLLLRHPREPAKARRAA